MVCPWYLELLVYACYDLGVYEPWLLCAHPRTNLMMLLKATLELLIFIRFRFISLKLLS